MVENIDNGVTEDNITKGNFQEIMGLMAEIDLLGEIEPMDMAPKKTPDEDYPSY